MKHTFYILLLCISIIGNATACNNDPINSSIENNDDYTKVDNKIKIKVNSKTFTAVLDENATAEAFKAQLPITIDMKELNGNEKLYNLPERLPTNASNPKIIQNGDLMLFGSNTLVLFYKTFPTSYSYTRLGRIEDPSGLASALGSGNVIVTFEMEQDNL